MTNLATIDWEGGANGAAVTAAGSGWDSVLGVASLTFSSTHVVSGQGTLCGHLSIAGDPYEIGQSTFADSNAVYVSFPLESVTAPDVNFSLASAKGNNSADAMATLRMTTDRRLKVQDVNFLAVTQTPAGMIADGQSGRIEWLVDHANGVTQLRYYTTATASVADWDSGPVSISVPEQIDTVNIGSLTTCTWESYIGDVYIDDNAFHSYGATPPPSGSISFVGAAHNQATGTGQTISVTVPAGVQGGDQMTLKLIGGSATNWTDTAPAGWTALGISQTGALPKFHAWKKTAAGTVGSASSDVGTTVTITSNNTSGSYYRNLHLEVYRNAQIGDIGSRMEGANTTNHITPAVSTVDPTAWIEVGCADRNSPSAQSFSLPSALTARSTEIVTSGGSSVSSVCASDDLVGAGTPPTYTITASDSNSSALTWAIVLEPTGTTNPVSVTVPSDFTSEPWVDTTVTPMATGTVTSWSWQQISPVEPDIVTGATVDPDGTIHLHLPGDLALQVYTLRALAHVTGVSPDAGDNITITVYPATRRWIASDGTVWPLHVLRVV